MSLFSGCSNILSADNSNIEFVVSSAPERRRNGTQLCSANLDGPRSNNRSNNASNSHTSRINTQTLGRALSVAVSGIGDHVKTGSEILWRSAVNAAGQAVIQRFPQIRIPASPSLYAGVSSGIDNPFGGLAFTTGKGPNSPSQLRNCRDTAAASYDGGLKVWGDGMFYLDLKPVVVNGEEIGKLMAIAKPVDDFGEPLMDEEYNCTYTWFRILTDDSLIEISEVTGNLYHISADDIGKRVKVTCTSCIVSDEAVIKNAVLGCGVRHASIGPFFVDARTNSMVLKSMNNGGTRFCCYLTKDTENSNSSSCAIDGGSRMEDNMVNVHVSSDGVSVTGKGGSTFSSMDNGCTRRIHSYTQDYPVVELHPLSSSTLTLHLEENNSISLCAESRYMRDALALTVRCFQARSLVGASIIIDKVTELNNFSGDNEIDDRKIDLFSIIQNLNFELSHAVSARDRLSRDFERTLREKRALEEEMTSTIEAFQAQLDAVCTNTSQPEICESANENAAIISSQLEQAKKREEALEVAIKSLRDELLSIENNNTAKEELQISEKKLLNQIKFLEQEQKQKDEALLKLQMQCSEYEAKASASEFSVEGIRELKFEVNRLRKEIEAAHIEKHRVCLQFEDARQSFAVDSRKLSIQISELQQELVHANARANSLAEEVKSVRSSTLNCEEASSLRVRAVEATLKSKETQFEEQTNAVEKLERNLESTIAERNRLLRLVDSQTKDLERAKAISESSADATKKLQEELQRCKLVVLDQKQQIESYQQQMKNELQKQKLSQQQQHMTLMQQIEKKSKELLEESEYRKLYESKYNTAEKDQNIALKQIQAYKKQVDDLQQHVKGLQKEIDIRDASIEGNTLAVESQNIEAEEQKKYFQETVEKLEKELQNSKASCAQHMQQLKSTQGSFEKVQRQQEEIIRLRAESEATSSTMQRLEIENKTLKSRLRKLFRGKAEETSTPNDISLQMTPEKSLEKYLSNDEKDNKEYHSPDGDDNFYQCTAKSTPTSSRLPVGSTAAANFTKSVWTNNKFEGAHTMVDIPKINQELDIHSSPPSPLYDSPKSSTCVSAQSTLCLSAQSTLSALITSPPQLTASDKHDGCKEKQDLN